MAKPIRGRFLPHYHFIHHKNQKPHRLFWDLTLNTRWETRDCAPELRTGTMDIYLVFSLLLCYRVL